MQVYVVIVLMYSPPYAIVHCATSWMMDIINFNLFKLKFRNLFHFEAAMWLMGWLLFIYSNQLNKYTSVDGFNDERGQNHL